MLNMLKEIPLYLQPEKETDLKIHFTPDVHFCNSTDYELKGKQYYINIVQNFKSGLENTFKLKVMWLREDNQIFLQFDMSPLSYDEVIEVAKNSNINLIIND